MSYTKEYSQFGKPVPGTFSMIDCEERTPFTRIEMQLFLKMIWCVIALLVALVIVNFLIAASGGFSPKQENKITLFIYLGMLAAPVLSLVNIILLWLIYRRVKHQMILRKRRFRMAVAWIISIAEALVSFPFLVLWFFWPLEILKI